MSQVKRKKDLDTPQAMAFEIHSPVRLEQLDAEMVTAMGWRKSASLTAEGSLTETSANNPAVLIVGHENANQNVLLSAITAHVPDPEWTPKGGVSKATLNEVRAHAKAGATLSPDEIQIALRYLLFA